MPKLFDVTRLVHESKKKITKAKKLSDSQLVYYHARNHGYSANRSSQISNAFYRYHKVNSRLNIPKLQELAALTDDELLLFSKHIKR